MKSLAKHKTLTQLLGICPAIAATAYVHTALAMGVALFITITVAAFVVSRLKADLTPRTRLVAQVAVVVMVVASLQVLLRAFWFDTAKLLSPYLALVAASCFTFDHCESCIGPAAPDKPVREAAGQGFIYMLLLLAIAIPRELLGVGSFFGFPLPFALRGNMLLAAPAGAFFVGAIVLWIVQARLLRKGDVAASSHAQGGAA